MTASSSRRIPAYRTESNGVENTLSAVWGKNFDRGFVGIGAEWVDSERVSLDDRPWTAGCDQHAEVTESGEVRSQDQFYSNVLGMEWDQCALGLLARRVSVPVAGSIYYTPGSTNGGWPNFSESEQFLIIGVDGNGDGQADVNYRRLRPERQAAKRRPLP